MNEAIKTKILITSGLLGVLFADFLNELVNNRWQFISIFLVVFLDAFLGVFNALKQREFETRKAFKSVYILVAFWSLLIVLISIEKGYPFASFATEAVLLPIISFQVISILKNMRLLGWIDNRVFNKILENIDKHKNK